MYTITIKLYAYTECDRLFDCGLMTFTFQAFIINKLETEVNFVKQNRYFEFQETIRTRIGVHLTHQITVKCNLKDDYSGNKVNFTSSGHDDFLYKQRSLKVLFPR